MSNLLYIMWGKNPISLFCLWLSRCPSTIWGEDYLYFKQIPKLFDGQLSWKPISKVWPNKTLWRVKAGKIVVKFHTWEEKLGKGRESWVLVKMRGKKKQVVGCLMRKENWSSNEHHSSHSHLAPQPVLAMTVLHTLQWHIPSTKSESHLTSISAYPMSKWRNHKSK